MASSKRENKRVELVLPRPKRDIECIFPKTKGDDLDRYKPERALEILAINGAKILTPRFSLYNLYCTATKPKKR